jgi:hypothetical protein
MQLAEALEEKDRILHMVRRIETCDETEIQKALLMVVEQLND